MNRKYSGILLLAASSFIYGLYGIFSRNIIAFGSFSQGFVRYSIVIIALLILSLSSRTKWKRIERKDLKWFLVWILPASFQPILTFLAFTHLPVGLVYFLLYSTMILGGITSGKVFFSEKLNKYKKISIILIFAGLYFIYRNDLRLVTNIYVLLALLSGLIVGFWNTLTKKVSTNYPEFQMMFMDSFSTFAVCLVGLLFVRETLPNISNYFPWIWIIVFGLLSLSATLLLIKGFKLVEAQIGSLILPLEIVFASILSYLFLNEVLSVSVYLGGVCIFLAALLPAFKQNYKTQTTL